MTSDTSSSLLSMNLTTENPSLVEHEQRTREDHAVNLPLSYIEQQKPSSSSSQSLSLGDHRRLALSDFHDPLYYQPALQLHCNLSHPLTLASGYETGDRVRSTNDVKTDRGPKRKSSSLRTPVRRSTSTSGQERSSKKPSGETMTRAVSKTKAQRHKRQFLTKKIKSIDSRQDRLQSKARRSTSLQSHRQQKKKTLMKQRVKSSKGTVTKARQKRSFPSTRRLNLTSNQLASVVRPRRSIIGSNQSHRKSIPHLSENSKISMLFDSMKQQGKTKSTHSTASSKTKGTKKPVLPSTKSSIKGIDRCKSKRRHSQNQLSTDSRGSTHHGKQTKQGSRRKFPRCTSKTLVTIAPTDSIHSNLIASLPSTKNPPETRTSPSIGSFAPKTKLDEQLSTTSAGMPLTKNSAQLTSKNNNGRRREPQTKGRPKAPTSMRTGMTLRSRTIIIKPIDTIRRKSR